MNQDEMNNLHREPFKEASNQISIHLGKRIQRRRLFRNQPIRNKNCLWWPCLLTDWDEISNLYRGPSIDAFYQVSDHLAKQFQRRLFQKSANQKQELPVAAMFVNGSSRNEQSLQGTFQRCFLPSFGSFGNTVSEDLYRGPSIDASYQVLVHLAKWFQRRRFKKNRPIRNKNCLWWTCLLMDRDKISKFY